MPKYICCGCGKEFPCILQAQGELPLPDKCPWGLDKVEWGEVGKDVVKVRTPKGEIVEFAIWREEV